MTAANHHQQNMDKVQNQALKIITCAMRSKLIKKLEQAKSHAARQPIQVFDRTQDYRNSPRERLKQNQALSQRYNQHRTQLPKKQAYSNPEPPPWSYGMKVIINT